MNINSAIHGAIEGDRLCQKHIYKTYARMLLTVCRRYNLAGVESTDILQEAFIEIFKSLAKYDPAKGKFESWITTITIRSALKLARKYKNNTVDIDTVFDLPLSQETAIDKMSAEELMVIIDKIPNGYKEIFNLYVIDGYSHREIGEMLNIKESTSRSKLMRARDMIGERILRNNQKLRVI